MREIRSISGSETQPHPEGTAKAAKVQLIFAMMIFGTIGIFRRSIPLPSSVIAMMRGFIGMAVLWIFLAVRGRHMDWDAVRSKLFWLILSGTALGFNWILLFEAYQYTSVATATLCYYMAPILLILVSPLLFGEKLTAGKLVCVVTAFAGMVCISGVFGAGVHGLSELRGILLGLGAAVLYACVVILNKKIGGAMDGYDKTIVQLGLAGLVLLPYNFLTVDMTQMSLTVPSVLLLLLVGVLHTGVAYACYFGCMEHLRAQTVALFSYIDPVIAILLSALLLREPMGWMEILGSVMVLGAAVMSERGNG